MPDYSQYNLNQLSNHKDPISGLRGWLLGEDTARAQEQMMTDYNRQVALDFWQMENEYNSPQQQMARLKEAGLNPHLAYGNGSVSNTSQATAPTGTAPKMSNADPTAAAFNSLKLMESVITSFVRVKKDLAQIQGIETNNKFLPAILRGKEGKLKNEVKWLADMLPVTRSLRGRQSVGQLFNNLILKLGLQDEGIYAWADGDGREGYASTDFRDLLRDTRQRLALDDLNTSLDDNEAVRSINKLRRALNAKGLDISDDALLRLLAHGDGPDLSVNGLLGAIYGEKALEFIGNMIPKLGWFKGSSKRNRYRGNKTIQPVDVSTGEVIGWDRW